MQSVRRIALTLPLSILLLAGCGKGSAPMAPASGSSAEQKSASDEVARHPELVEDGMYTSEMQAPAGSASAPAGSLAAIHPLFFWRQINHDERTFEFAFSDTDSTGAPTTAVVTVHRLLSGTFNVVAKNPAESIILLGQLHFAPISGTDIQGTWDLKQWSGTDVPGLPGSGAMTGTLFGTAAILRLELPGTESTLGVVIDHAVDGRVAGRIDLLPSGTFHGRIEAIRATP